MADAETRPPAPVRLDLELPPELLDRLEAGGTAERARDGIERELHALLHLLGVPAPDVLPALVPAPAARAERWLRVRVEGRPLPYPDALLEESRGCAERRPAAPDADPVALRRWLEGEVDGGGGGAERAAAFLVHAVLEIVKRTPGALLTPGLADAYLAALPRPAGPGGGRLHRALRDVLSLGVSLADRETVAGVLEASGADAPPEELAEALVDALRPRIVGIRFAPGYLRELTLGDSGAPAAHFAALRDSLFFELGTRYPDFGFVTDPLLEPGSFAFTVNHLPTAPRFGPRPGDAVPGESPMEHVALSLGAELRRHRACFVHRQGVVGEIEQLLGVHPVLVAAARESLPMGRLTRALRLLVAEGVSIRNLRGILERLLERDFVVADELTHLVMDDRLPVPAPPPRGWLEEPVNLAAVARIGLRRQLCHRYAAGQQTIGAYLLDPALESRLAASRLEGVELPEGEREALVALVRREAAGAWPEGPVVILATTGARSALRRALAPELPDLPVLAYQEIAPETSIQVLGRLAAP